MNRIPTPMQSRFPTAAALALALGALLASAPARAAETTTVITTTTTTSSGSSVSVSGGDPYAMGEEVLFVSISAPGYGYYGSSLVPPLVVGFDYGFHPYMTLGGIFGFSQYDYVSDNLTYLTFAARGTFHPIFWLNRMRIPLDPYGTATVGYTVANWSGPYSRNFSRVIVGPGVGARYWFTPKFAGQAEAGLGYGVDLASIGLAFKF